MGTDSGLRQLIKDIIVYIIFAIIILIFELIDYFSDQDL